MKTIRVNKIIQMTGCRITDLEEILGFTVGYNEKLVIGLEHDYDKELEQASKVSLLIPNASDEALLNLQHAIIAEQDKRMNQVKINQYLNKIADMISELKSLGQDTIIIRTGESYHI